ncbi:hypothetical protein K4F52_004856 [Lecanicillium sp. MT-2017a]|nr:hypothetical protein K4F52_004856 [Lecanicillium sp. MT-2017a]
MPWFNPNPTFTASRAALVLVPVIAPAAYVLYWNWTIRKSCSSQTGFLPRSRATIEDATDDDTNEDTKAEIPSLPKSLPTEVIDSPAEWVVSFERVASRPVPLSLLVTGSGVHGKQGSDALLQPSSMLNRYLRATHRAFSWTPQAILIRSMLKEQDCRDSFTRDWINGLAFRVGNLVNGVYRVSHYAGDSSAGVERVELLIDTPASYTGPPVRGLILAVLEKSTETAVFINETWLWRRQDEKPTLLESPFGKWFHGLLAGWMVIKGIAGVTARNVGQDGRKA